jgi:hypothetical protein
MKSLLWKEWQENLKWAALPLLVLGGLMALLGPPSLMDYGALLILGLIAAVFGAVLGFLQVFPESHGDKRSLLLHRPLGPSRIFLGKAAVGVALYLLAMGIPFAGAVAWIATPGHVAEPFHWAMALPWLADILTGLVYYFAGMLTAQREARWYGSRTLGLGAAVLCTFLVWVVPEFWQAVLVVAVMCTVVGLAAWGSFLAGGAYSPQPRLARAALAATLLAGLLVVGVTIKVLVGGCAFERYMSYYTLDREGRVLVVRWRPGDIQSVTNLDGERPEVLKGKQLDSNAIRQVEAPVSAPVGLRYRTYRGSGRFFVRCRNESSSGDERWFYVPEDGLLRGYDGRSRRLVGSCGPDGFVPADQKPRERFRGEAYHTTFLYETGSVYFLSLADRVYALDFARHTIRTLFTPAQGETVLAATRWRDDREKWSRAVVVTDRSVHVLDEAGTPLLSAPLAYDQVTHGRISVAQLDGPRRYAVWYEPSWYLWPSNGKTLSSYLVEYDLTGREVARRTVPPRPLNGAPQGLALFGLATPPVEAAVIAGATQESVAAARRTQGQEVRPVAFFVAIPTQLFIPGAGPDMAATGGVIVAYQSLILLSALACAALCFLLARRHSFSRAGRVGWGLCGLLFGPAGLLLMLALHQWPARVTCPACRLPRVVTRDACEHCGAPFALPAPDSTEIFEPDDATPEVALACAGRDPAE